MYRCLGRHKLAVTFDVWWSQSLGWRPPWQPTQIWHCYIIIWNNGLIKLHHNHDTHFNISHCTLNQTRGELKNIYFFLFQSKNCTTTQSLLCCRTLPASCCRAAGCSHVCCFNANIAIIIWNNKIGARGPRHASPRFLVIIIWIRKRDPPCISRDNINNNCNNNSNSNQSMSRQIMNETQQHIFYLIRNFRPHPPSQRSPVISRR